LISTVVLVKIWVIFHLLSDLRSKLICQKLSNIATVLQVSMMTVLVMNANLVQMHAVVNVNQWMDISIIIRKMHSFLKIYQLHTMIISKLIYKSELIPEQLWLDYKDFGWILFGRQELFIYNGKT
jgi:hypothetical protein